MRPLPGCISPDIHQIQASDAANLSTEFAMSDTNPYARGLDRNAANFAPLTPLTLIDWAASTYPDALAVVHGAQRYTWAETHARCRRLASALIKRGIGAGDTVAAMLPNIPA